MRLWRHLSAITEEDLHIEERKSGKNFKLDNLNLNFRRDDNQSLTHHDSLEKILLLFVNFEQFTL